MNLVITIFGGMLLTVLLYGAARLFRLSNYWAAAAAAGIPVTAYLVYAVGTWPGLDVVTIHVVAYPTVAVLLYQMNLNKSGEHLKVHWAPKLMIGFFVLLTITLGAFVYIAGNGLPPALAQILLPNARGKNIHTGFSGIVAHGEEAAKSIAHQRSIDDRLAKLGWDIEVDGLGGLSSERASEVKVRLRKSGGSGISGQKLGFGLSRPGQKAQTEQPMQDAGNGDYRITLVLPADGAWLASISFTAGGKRIVLEHPAGKE